MFKPITHGGALAIAISSAFLVQTSHAELAPVQPQVGVDWPFYGGDHNAQRFSPLKQITPKNVGRLERAFVYHTRDLPNPGSRYSPETTPVKVGSDLLMCSAKNILISIDAATGKENWRHDPGVPDQAIPHAAACRGVAVYTAPQLPETAQCRSRVADSTPFGHSAHADPDTCSTIIRTGSRSAATQGWHC